VAQSGVAEDPLWIDCVEKLGLFPIKRNRQDYSRQGVQPRLVISDTHRSAPGRDQDLAPEMRRRVASSRGTCQAFGLIYKPDASHGSP
jgi:hypothetical protein